MSVIKLDNHCVVKASKHFFIRAMETVGESGLYSKLQEVNKFAEYLKHNVAEWHVQSYYINNITPRIALNNFRYEQMLQKKLSEWDSKLQALGDIPEEQEQVMKQKLERLKLAAGTPDALIAETEKFLRDREEIRRRLDAQGKEWKNVTSVINEWVEKGYALAIIWTVSTGFAVCEKNNLETEIGRLEVEIDRIWNQSVKARAYEQQLWLEEIKEPIYTLHAEYAGLFHPSIRDIYKEYPLLQSFATDLEQYFNARLQQSIERANFREESSTAIAEALASFLRHIAKVEKVPGRIQSKIDYGAIKQPVYMGLIATPTQNGLEETGYPFIFDASALSRHVLITGTSGSGKTRVGQLITEAISPDTPVVVLDPMGEFTGLIEANPNVGKETQFKIPKGCSYSPTIYTLDDEGLKFEANLLKRPNVKEDRLVSEADQVSLVLCELINEDRLRDVFRNVILQGWKRGDLAFETFLATCRNEAAQRKISVKLDRLAPYKSLMSPSAFDVQSLFHGITIFTFNTSRYTDSEKLMFMWFILRELSNYFLNQLHSDELKLLVLVDEAHRFYAEGTPRSAATALESLNKQGRGRGLGMVILTQTIKDLPVIFTQADTRFLLKIAEGEMEAYASKFSTDLARKLRTLGPREAYIFLGSEQFFCKLRPTLSNPKGITSTAQLGRYSAPQRALDSAIRRLTNNTPQIPTQTSPPNEPLQQPIVVSTEPKPDLEHRAVEVLRKKDGISASDLRRALDIHSQAVITKLVNSLESKGVIKTKPVANIRKIWLKPQKSESSPEKV
ncbi:MAG: ATP-binding protein [Candidatus Bathyarchaeia archaeon]